MLRNYMGIINLEEKENDIRSLTANRPIGTIPIGGRFRVIDFILSDMITAGLTHISVFAAKSTRSLSDHLGSGKPWDLDRKTDGLFTFSHSILGSVDNATAQTFGMNMEFFSRAKQENVILASSYMIANMDLDYLAEQHEASGADISVVYKPITNGESDFLNCDLIKFDKNNRVMNISKNIGIEENVNVCMEIFFMKKKLLTELLYKAAADGAKGAFKEFIYNNILSYHVNALPFTGYARCINSVESFYNTNMDMLELEVTGELFSPVNPIYTKTKDSPPAHYVQGSDVSHAIVADGSIICGTVKNSVIFRNVRIEEGAVLDGCIVLPNVTVGKNAVLSNVIVDKGVVIDDGVTVQCPKQYPLVFEKKSYTKV